jgi:MFS family permease
MVTFSIGFMFIVISATPMAADLSPSEKYIGTYVSLTAFVGSLGPVLGPILGGWLVGMFNNNYSAIWPAVAVIFVLTFLSLIPITKGEARKTVAEDQMVGAVNVL